MINTSCVVLNSTYEPLTIVPSKRALILCLQDKAIVVQNHDYKIRSPSIEMDLPATIALKQYVKSHKIYSRKATLTQRNLFIRDNHKCQYCGRSAKQLSGKESLTRDHIIPVCKGGQNVWENVVTSCSTCNNKKGDLTLDQCSFTLKIQPRAPTLFELFAKSKMKHFQTEQIYTV